MRTLNSKVMIIANKLVKEGYNRSNAMVKAWILAKLPQVETKVSGVTYGKLQTAIEHLTRYKPENNYRLKARQVKPALPQCSSGNSNCRREVIVLAMCQRL